MSLELVTAPTEEPVTVDEAKDHLCLVNGDHDAYVESLIIAARLACEVELRQSLLTTTWRQRLQAWPSCGVIELHRPPLQSVTSITYYDGSGVLQTLSASEYVVDTASMPGRVLRAYGATWPTLRTEGVAAPVTITFVAGRATAAAVPATVKHAMKLLIGHWFESREEVSANRNSLLPMAAKSLLAKASHGSYP